MIKFFRKHKKKALAVATIGLMISFAVTIGPSGRTNNRSKTVIGSVNGKPVHLADLDTARVEWQALRRYVASPRPDSQTGQYGSLTDVTIGGDVSRAIDEKPELFMLLVREAKDAGLRISKDEVESAIVNGYRRPVGEDESTDDLVRSAVEDLLLVESNFARLSSIVKVSAPLREQVLAKAAQKVQLNVVELSAVDFATKVSVPTTQQAQDQFERYANVTPGLPNRNNPFGIGYRLPDRVKVQYLTIDRAEVEKAVQATRTPYQWEVEARLYYRKNREQFAATQPATLPATLASAGTSQPSTTAPAFKPFEEVREQVLQATRDPMVDKLTFEVQNKLNSVLSADWRAFSQKMTTTGPATASVAGGDYPSYEYLKGITDTVRAQTGVNVFVADYGRDLSARDLMVLPGISQTYDSPTSPKANTFAAIALEKAKGFLGRADKDSAAARAQLLQPAQPLSDYKRNVFIFRLTDARAAQQAPDLDTVRDKVDADLKRRDGYEMAAAVAQDQLLPAAKSGSLPSAAMAMGKGVLTTEAFNVDPFHQRPAEIGASISLSTPGLIDFADEAFSLLTEFSAGNPAPVKLIKIPQDAKVYLAQLLKVTPDWDAENFHGLALQATAYARRQLATDLRKDWFNADAVMQRLGYKSENQKNEGG